MWVCQRFTGASRPFCIGPGRSQHTERQAPDGWRVYSLSMKKVNIPNKATHTPVALTDVLMGAPLASRLLLGATVPGQILSAAALGYYAGSAIRDWRARQDIVYIDFQAEYGADVGSLPEMPAQARRDEAAQIAAALVEDFTDEKRPREALAEQVAKRLTAYLASVTGQEVTFSTAIRDFTLSKVFFPSALGACDALGGDIALFQDTGLIEPHVIAHEFCHRVGYLKELHAQVLAYLALRTSNDPVLIQAARAERLLRHASVLSGGKPDKVGALLAELGLSGPMVGALVQARPATRTGTHSPFAKGMRALYEQRMRLTGQNGLSDYDEGFTSLLWNLGRSDTAKQPSEHAAP